MNKFCEVCRKVFEFDEVLNPFRRYCSKTCYISVLRKKTELPEKSWFVRFKEFCKSLFE